MAKILTTLPDCAQTIVYQMVVAAIKADATLAALVKPDCWTTYTEGACAKRNVPMDNNGLPCIRMMPFSAGVTPEAQVIQNAPLGIAITVTTPGHDVRDIMNLWGVLARSIFTGDAAKTLGNAIRAALQAASTTQGSNIGSMQTFRLGLSGIGPSTDSNGSLFMTAEGIILVEMTIPK